MSSSTILIESSIVADLSAYDYFLFIFIAVDFCIMLDDMIPSPTGLFYPA